MNGCRPVTVRPGIASCDRTKQGRSGWEGSVREFGEHLRAGAVVSAALPGRWVLVPTGDGRSASGRLSAAGRAGLLAGVGRDDQLLARVDEVGAGNLDLVRLVNDLPQVG